MSYKNAFEFRSYKIPKDAPPRWKKSTCSKHGFGSSTILTHHATQIYQNVQAVLSGSVSLTKPPYLVCEGNCGFRQKNHLHRTMWRKSPTTLHFFGRQAPNPNMYSNYSNHKHQTSEKNEKTTMTLQENQSFLVWFERLLEGKKHEKNTNSKPKRIDSPLVKEFAQIFPAKRQQHPNAGIVKLQLQQLWNVDTSPQLVAFRQVDH